MAKYGEGDKRWIVEDRPDGTNVHNWHWSETDCLEYSRTFFTTTFNNLTLFQTATLTATTTSLEKCDGEAYVNIRKGKIIPGYELAIVVNFEVEEKDDNGNSNGVCKGKIEIPYLSDENAGEDPEVRVSVEEEGERGRKVKAVVLEKGRSVIWEKVRGFVECMARGGPCKEELETKKPVEKKEGGSVVVEKKAAEEKEKEKAKAVAKKEKEKERKGFRTVKLSEKFRCRAKDLYEILMDEMRWKGFTQSNARISKEVGGEFSIFDGSVTGTNVELQEGKLIVQKWRFGNWPEGVFSTVKLTFEEPEPGITVVKLVQTDVPEEDSYGNETVVENTERGWRDLIFQRIRAIFGFGL